MNYVLVIIAVISVSVGDVLIKRSAAAGSLIGALKTPWLAGAVILYLVQIFLFTVLFVRGWKLTVVGNLQIIFYALTILLVGTLFFHERLSVTQWVGIVLGGVAVWLIGK